MTKVQDKILLQLSIKASGGDREAESQLVSNVCTKYDLITRREHAEALALTRASSEPETVETPTEPETTDTPQEAV